MFKHIALACSIFVGTISLAAEPIGIGEKLKLNFGANGKPSVALSYSYDSEWKWQINFTSTKNAQDIGALPRTIAWTLFDITNNQTPTRQWYPTDRSSIILGPLRVDKPSEVAAVLGAPQRHLVILFGRPVGSGHQILFHLPLAEICSNYPTHVRDLTNSAQPACEVNPADLVNADCESWRQELLEQVNEGIISCADGNELFHAENCRGELGC